MPGLGGEEKKRATWEGETTEGRVIRPKGKKAEARQGGEGEGETEEGRRQDRDG